MAAFCLFISVLLFPHSILCDHGLELIWNDPMDDLDNWQSAGSVRIVDGSTSNAIELCSSKPSCIETQGPNNANFIVRTISLSEIKNINLYETFQLKLDVHLFSTEPQEYCQISTKYSDEPGFQQIHIVPDRGFDEHALDEIINIPVRNAATLQIKLSVNANNENDRCYWDNVRLYGRTRTNLIWFDPMNNLNQWFASGNVDINGFSQCFTGSCVEIRGGMTSNDWIIRETSNILDSFHSFTINFDVVLFGMEEEDGCQILYRYNNENEFKLLRSVGGVDDINVGWRTQIVSIPAPPNSNSNSLFIKLENNGDSTSRTPGDACYFDNVHLRGESGKTPTDQYLDNIKLPSNQHNIYIIGDFGGDDDFPFTTTEQLTVAAMMKTVKYTNKYDISGIIALGDNMYDDGVSSSFSSRFDSTFTNVYQTSPIISQIDWFLVAGNHDHRGSVQAQIGYSGRNQFWNFPHFYYSKIWNFNGITLQFVGVDTFILCGFAVSGGTNRCSPGFGRSEAEKHWSWISTTLQQSTADFLIVGAHVPIYSYNRHGPSQTLIDRLRPILEANNVDAYLSGHEHILTYIENKDEHLQYIISGAGHGCRHGLDDINNRRNPMQNDPMQYFNCNQGGFVRLSIDSDLGTMQAHFYIGATSTIKFSTGIWYSNGTYENVESVLRRLSRPTSIPSKPTSKPTLLPTNPTMHPSNLPTETTSRPTLKPTDPTTQPTNKRTRPPTPQPTANPTSRPTNAPSRNPTPNPTTQPTAIPSETSTTFSPTESTSNPTAQPTSQPTNQPILNPSVNPTPNPTGMSTSNPASQPSLNPADNHTDQPTEFVATCCNCLAVSFQGNGTAECMEDPMCRQIVCVIGDDRFEHSPDPFCCSLAWDSVCAAAANTICNDNLPSSTTLSPTDDSIDDTEQPSNIPTRMPTSISPTDDTETSTSLFTIDNIDETEVLTSLSPTDDDIDDTEIPTTISPTDDIDDTETPATSVKSVCCDCLTISRDPNGSEECKADVDCTRILCVVGDGRFSFSPDRYCCEEEFDSVCVDEANFICTDNIARSSDNIVSLA